MMKEKATELLQARKRLAKQMPDPAIALAGSLIERIPNDDTNDSRGAALGAFADDLP